MGFTKLFTTSGRLSRKTFILAWAGNTAQLLCLGNMFPTMFDTGNAAVTGAACAYMLATTWVFVCIAAKRWHDANRSGLYTLMMLVPVVGIAATLLSCLLLDGTRGPNRFGQPAG